MGGVILPILLIILGRIILMKWERSVFGVILFTFGILLLLLSLVIGVINTVSENFIYGDVISFLTIVFIFFGIVFYFFNNSKIMINKEGSSITAKLSLVFGLNLLIVVACFLGLYGLKEIGNFYYSIIYYALLPFFFFDFLFILLFIFYVFYSWIYQEFPVNKEVDYIIILGSGISSEKVPPLLKSRLDKAIEYYVKNPQAKLVVSGGKGSDEPVSEAFAMKEYLLSQNICEKSILVEDRSTSTLENMKFSKEVIEKDWTDLPWRKVRHPSIIFTTNNYHVLRAATYARKVKLKVEGVGAPTALYFLPSALIREFVALILHNKLIVLLAFVFFAFVLLLFQ